MAVLEEWIQEKYAEFYEESDDYVNKPELLNAKIKDFLLKDGTKKYVTYNGKMYYLINKSSLPNEIKDGLVGGDSTEYAKYIRLQDVYGVTTDLKVYYCSDQGLDGEVLGKMEDLEVDPTQPAVGLNKNTVLSEQVKSELSGMNKDVEGDITLGDLESVGNLTLDGTKLKEKNLTLENLNGISELRKLKNLVIKDLTLPNLDGIESCSMLQTIYFDNSFITEETGYDKLATVIDLNKLYIRIDSKTEEGTANKEIEKISTSLGKATLLNKLNYFGVFGSYSYINLTSADFSGGGVTGKFSYSPVEITSRSKLSDISSFSKFSDTVKGSIKYLYLQENNLNSISSLSRFPALYELVICGNSNLTSLEGLENHTTLSYLIGQYSGVELLDGLTGCSGLTNVIMNNNSLKSLTGLSSEVLSVLYLPYNKLEDISSVKNCKTLLSHVNLEYNTDSLSDISALKYCTKIVKCYLEGNTNLDEDFLKTQEFKTLLGNCGSNYSLNKKYGLIFLDGAKQDFYEYGLTDEQLKLLEGNLNIKGIRLGKNPSLTSEVINEVLGSMTNLESVDLEDCSQVTSISFVSYLPKLADLNLFGTSVTDLSILETWAISCQEKPETFPLSYLAIDNPNIDVSNIQTLISLISKKGEQYGSKNAYAINRIGRGLYIKENELCSRFASCTEITNFFSYADVPNNTNYGTVDLSKCSKLNYVGIRRCGYTVKVPESCTYVYADSYYTWLDLSLTRNLTKASFGWWQCSGGVDNVLENLKQNTNLKSLSLDYAGVGGTVTKLGVLKTTTAVDLNFSNNRITNFVINEDISLNINDFYLNNNPKFYTLDGFEHIASINTLNITNDIVSSLKPLVGLTSLTSITATNNKISSLDGVQNLTNLTTLSVGQNSISDLYYLGLLADKGAIALKTLDLSNNLLENSTTISIDTDGDGIKENVFVDNLEIIEKLYRKGCTNINLTNNGNLDTTRLSQLSGVKY